MSDICINGKDHEIVGATCRVCWIVRQGEGWCSCRQPATQTCAIHASGRAGLSHSGTFSGCTCQLPGKDPCPFHYPGSPGPRGKSAVIKLLIARDGPNCTYCGINVGTLDGITNWPSKDHAIPTIRGGTNTLDNLVLACERCNNLKGAKTPEEFWAWLEKQGLIKEDREVHEEHG